MFFGRKKKTSTLPAPYVLGAVVQVVCENPGRAPATSLEENRALHPQLSMGLVELLHVQQFVHCFFVCLTNIHDESLYAIFFNI